MAIINAASSAELATALTKAVSGDTILLAPGEYSANISNLRPSSGITISSADSANPARLRWLSVIDSSNLTFKGVDIGRALTSTDTISGTTMAKVSGSSGITFDSVHVYSSLDGNATNDGVGLAISSSTGVKVINSEFEQLFRALVLSGVEDSEVLGNKFHDIRSDGIDGISVRRIKIDGNSFTDFYKVAGDHADAIQFWTTGTTKASTDITITNNVLMQGEGGSLQGIFLRDELGTLPFERVLIENNLVYEADMANGITVIGGKDVTIRQNTVVSPTGDATSVWIRVEAITNGLIDKNVADKLYLGSLNVTVGDNVFFTDSPTKSLLLSGLNLRSLATIGGLILPGYGYQIPVSSADTTTTTTTEPVPTTDTTVIAAPTSTDTTTTTTAPTTTTTTSPTTTTTDTSTTTPPTTTTTTTDTSTTTTTTTTTTEPKPTSKLIGWGRGGSKKTASLVEKTAITSVDTSTTSFTTDGLYTGSYSYSGTTSTAKSKPLTAASANTTLSGSAFRSRYQLFHA